MKGILCLIALTTLCLLKGGTTAENAQIPSVGGWAVGIGHTRTELWGGYNRITLQYGVGAAANFSTAIDDPTPVLQNATRNSSRACRGKERTHGSPLAPGRFGISMTTFRWPLRQASTRRTAAQACMTAGFVSSPSRLRLAPDANSSAGPFSALSSLMQVGRMA